MNRYVREVEKLPARHGSGGDRKTRRTAGATVWLSPILFAVAVLFTAATSFAQMVTTDKLDYEPGDTVTISGEGWLPGEGLLLTIGDSSGTRERVQINATAGSDGKFTDRSFIVQATDLGRMLTLTVQGESGAVAFMAFRDAAAPGSLKCSTLTRFGSTGYYGLAPSKTVVCTIEGATDLSPAQQGGNDPVEVLVKTETFGNQPATVLSVSGTAITFQYTAPGAACGKATVSYGPLKVCDPGYGSCTTYPTVGNEANSEIISGSNAPAGFVFLSNGTERSCAQPKLQVEKAPLNGSFTEGSQVFYKIYIDNTAPAGSETAENVVLTDELPGNGGLIWQNAWTTQGTCANPIQDNKLNCTLGSIPPQGSIVVTVSSADRTPDAACQSQPNPDAVVTAKGGIKVHASGSLTCTPPPQLKVEKTPKQGTFAIGGPLTYTIVVSNPAPAGSNSATNVVLTDTLPNNGYLTWATVTTTAGICTLTQNSLSCQLGDIQAGGHVTVVVTSDPAPSSACQLQPNPHAVANADGCLTAEDWGSATCTMPPPPTPNPGLSMVKTPSTTTAAPGQMVIFTYKVKNTGNVTLQGIVVTDDNATPGDPDDDITVGTIPSLAPGATYTLTKGMVPRDNSIISRLGSAGPAKFAVLSLGGDAAHKSAGIYCSNGTVNGNVGVAGYGKFNNMAPCVENGDLYKGSNVTYTGPGKLNGATIVDDAQMDRLRNDAFNAATYFANLEATPAVQSQFPTNGSISGTRTVTGAPGLNVVKLTGLRLNGNLVLTGPAGTQFVLDISGTFDLHTGNITTSGGVGPYDVIYNITNPSATVKTMVPTTAVGILLAPYNSINAMDSSNFYGTIIGGYNNVITLLSATRVRPPTVPSPTVTNTATAVTTYNGTTVSATATATVTISSTGSPGHIVLPPPQ